MEARCENSGLTSSVDAAVGAVETVRGFENLNSLRQWIDRQHNIKWLTDDDFLGAFAQLSRVDENEAQNRLQRLLTSQKKRSRWFENLDPTDPKIQAVFNEGGLLLLPERDDNGKQLYTVRFGLDASKIDPESWMRALVVFFHYQFLIDYKDKAGTVAILDFAGATLESFAAIMPLDVVSEWVEILASHYPSRITDIHYIHCDEQIREKAVEVIRKPFPAETTANKIHSDTPNDLYKDVPMRCLPVEYLPVDYTGPNAGTIQQIIVVDMNPFELKSSKTSTLVWGPGWAIGLCVIAEMVTTGSSSAGYTFTASPNKTT